MCRWMRCRHNIEERPLKQTRRLKNRDELIQLRDKLLKEQGGLCTLCGNPIALGDASLDHDHKTGHCRSVLHKWCNALEGRIMGWANRVKGIPPTDFLLAVIRHQLRYYDHMPIHLTHKTEVEKKILKLKRRRSKLKTERGRQRLTDQIKELQENM